MELKIMELETKISELELEMMKWNKDIEDIHLGLTIQVNQQLNYLNKQQEKKEKEIENIKKELKEKIEKDLSKSDKNQILERMEELSKEVWNCNREIKLIKSDVEKLEYSNKSLAEKYVEIKESINFMVSETKERRKKKGIVICIIILSVISGYMSLSDEIDFIKKKINRFHGYGISMQIDNVIG